MIDSQPRANNQQLETPTREVLEALRALPSTPDLVAAQVIDSINVPKVVTGAVIATTLTTGIGSGLSAASAEVSSARSELTTPAGNPRKYVMAEPGDSQW